MKFIAFHRLDNNKKPYRFFLNVDRVHAVYPASDIAAKRGYRSSIETEDEEIAVTESMTTVIKRLNGESDSE